jgi:hypothetical protein
MAVEETKGSCPVGGGGPHMRWREQKRWRLTSTTVGEAVAAPPNGELDSPPSELDSPPTLSSSFTFA